MAYCAAHLAHLLPPVLSSSQRVHGMVPKSYSWGHSKV